MTPQRRKYIYSVLVSVGAVAVFYGLVTGEEVEVWLDVASTALLTGGVILARQNVPRDDDAE